MIKIAEQMDGLVVLTFNQSRLDAGNVANFRARFDECSDQATNVLLDMEGLAFVDSSGLGALVSALRKINARHGDLKLCAMSKPVRVVFELVRMHRIFEIHNTREEGIKSFSA